MGKTQLEKSESINQQISSNTKCNSKQTVEKANEHPEWLPDGWNVEVRTRKSGASMGHGYKCYIDPNGNKFYSKPEVLRYLETIKGNICAPKKEEMCNTMHSPNDDAVEKTMVEDLPPGWITEVKIRKGGNGNRKDLFYTDPLSGYVFRSKKDALRYLESGDISACVLKPKRRQFEDEDKLTPLSADKKQKLRQSATKRTLFVGKDISDESSLALPNANSSEKGQDVKGSSGMMVAPVPTRQSVVKIQSQENAAEYPTEIKKASVPGSSALLNIESLKESEKVVSAEAGFYLNPADDVQEKNHVVNLAESASKKNCSNRNLSKKEFNVGHRFSRRLAGVESDQLTNEQTLQVPKRNLRKSRTILNNDLANKSSQQLNDIPEIEHLHKMQGEVLNNTSMLSEGQAVFTGQLHQHPTDKIKDNKPEQNHYSLSRDSSLPSLKVAPKTIRAELSSPDDPNNCHGLASEARVLTENKLHESETRKSGSLEIHSNLNKSSNKKEHRIPCRVSKRLAGFEPELMSNSISHDRAVEYQSRKSKREVNADLLQSEGQVTTELADYASIKGESSNKHRKTPKIPLITNDHLEKPEDEEINDEKSEPQQSFAFHYSWSDPCLEFAIKTLTSALPVEDSVGNGPPQIAETVMLPHNNLFENATGSSSDKNPQVKSKKSKNKKELKMPGRSSKRLAGNEPELLPAERALEYATRKSCKDKPAATAILTNGACGHVHTGEESKLVHASGRLETRVCDGSSNKSEKSYDQTVPSEQVQRLEAENIDDRSEPQFPLPFGDSWSDPCLQFAIKTLTGALPVDAAAADILPVMTPDINNPPNKEFLVSVVQKSIDEEAHDNSNQPQTRKELNTVSQASKQPLDQLELGRSCTSCENDPKCAARVSYSDDGIITRDLDGQSPHIKSEIGNVTQIDINTLMLEEPLKENEQVPEGESVAGQPQLETETIKHVNSVREFCAPFMESWSDPCLEFAFKTLTGVIPVEDDIAIQGSFQELANHHDWSDGGSIFPESGSSSISQSDISFHTNVGEKSIPGQQSSMSSSFLPVEKSSLHSCPGVDPQRHYSQCNNNFQRR